MRALFRFWFAFEERVGREAYLRHGLSLMVVKYAVDVALVRAATGTFWTPLDYVQSAPFLLSSRLSGAASFLAPALAVWTLPFIWIGVSMTIRRLLDSGRSAWWVLLFFAPIVNYALLLFLSVAPSSETRPRPAILPDPSAARLPSALLSMALGAGVGLALIAISVFGMQSYGLSLFLGTPFIVGLVTAFALCRRYPASVRETVEVVIMTLLLLAGASFMFGIEGAICLLMAAPLGLAIGSMGGLMGRYLAFLGERPLKGAALLIVLWPGATVLEADAKTAHVREVRSSVVIEGAPEEVWKEVVAFSPIREEPSWLFRLGLAYPIRARVDGSGVGAVRYCVFSTGSFVEPITAWEPGVRLSFDVTESPSPLEELSIWKLSPPHLEGYLSPRAGEFRLVELPNGATRLEGSTWYEQGLRPEGYWVWFSDYLIGRIHMRVLEHIKAEVEGVHPSVALYLRWRGDE